MSHEKMMLLVKGIIIGSAVVGYKAAIYATYYKYHKEHIFKARHKNNLNKGGDED